MLWCFGVFINFLVEDLMNLIILIVFNILILVIVLLGNFMVFIIFWCILSLYLFLNILLCGFVLFDFCIGFLFGLINVGFNIMYLRNLVYLKLCVLMNIIILFIIYLILIIFCILIVMSIDCYLVLYLYFWYE